MSCSQITHAHRNCCRPTAVRECIATQRYRLSMQLLVCSLWFPQSGPTGWGTSCSVAASPRKRGHVQHTCSLLQARLLLRFSQSVSIEPTTWALMKWVIVVRKYLDWLSKYQLLKEFVVYISPIVIRTGTSKMLVKVYQTVQCHMSQDRGLRSYVTFVGNLIFASGCRKYTQQCAVIGLAICSSSQNWSSERSSQHL